MVGTWGQLLFPKPWKEFRLWYDIHKAKGIKPILQGMVTTGWCKRMGEKIWTPWFIKFVHSRGYFNIYTNFQQERALSISHRNAGVNYGRSVGPDSNLLDESSLNFNLWKLPPSSNLKWFDFCFKEVHPGRIVRSFDELGTVLDSSQKEKPIIIISLYRTEKRIARNLICHLGKVGMENFVLIIDNPEFMDNLARRGYAVIDANRLIRSSKIHNSVLNLENSGTDLMKEILVKAHLIKKCPELRYNLWLMDGNIIPISAKLPEPADQSYDFLATRDLELLFIKSSPTTLKFWIDGLVSTVGAQEGKFSIAGDNFMYLVNKALEARGILVILPQRWAVWAQRGFERVSFSILVLPVKFHSVWKLHEKSSLLVSHLPVSRSQQPVIAFRASQCCFGFICSEVLDYELEHQHYDRLALLYHVRCGVSSPTLAFFTGKGFYREAREPCSPASVRVLSACWVAKSGPVLRPQRPKVALPEVLCNLSV